MKMHASSHLKLFILLFFLILHLLSATAYSTEITDKEIIALIEDSWNSYITKIDLGSFLWF